jgi:hypothetical protein
LVPEPSPPRATKVIVSYSDGTPIS